MTAQAESSCRDVLPVLAVVLALPAHSPVCPHANPEPHRYEACCTLPSPTEHQRPSTASQPGGRGSGGSTAPGNCISTLISASDEDAKEQLGALICPIRPRLGHDPLAGSMRIASRLNVTAGPRVQRAPARHVSPFSPRPYTTSAGRAGRPARRPPPHPGSRRADPPRQRDRPPRPSRRGPPCSRRRPRPNPRASTARAPPSRGRRPPRRSRPIPHSLCPRAREDPVRGPPS